ncbi:MAG: phosphoenolpyruvate carboxykinase (ATP), partial [Spirochaetaceae bacterium]
EGHGTRLFLINTGWSGGPCGTNHRIDIELTRAMVRAAVSGELEEAAYHTDPIFGMQVPASCPEFPSDILFPASTWADRAAYERGAAKLAGEFRRRFESEFAAKVPERIAAACPAAPTDAATAT